MVEVWRRSWGRRPALTRSAPPPHTAPRGGIDATQVAPEPEIEGGDCGEGHAQQQSRVLGTGLCRTNELTKLWCTEVDWSRRPRIMGQHLLGERWKGNRIGTHLVPADCERDAPEQGKHEHEIRQPAPHPAPFSPTRHVPLPLVLGGVCAPFPPSSRSPVQSSLGLGRGHADNVAVRSNSCGKNK